MFEINNKNFFIEIITSEDSASLNSSLRENSASASYPTAGSSSHDSESLASEDSVGGFNY